MSETSIVPVIKIEMDMSQMEKVINAAVDQALQKHSFVNSLPPILTKAQFQELLDIGSTKAAELLNRRDFPVIREFGHPRILTHLLLQWCEQHTDWVQAHAGDSWKKVVGGN